MKNWAGWALGLGLSLGLAAGAKADTVSGTVDGFSGSGTLYVVSNGTGDGSVTITGIEGPGVTGLIAPGGFHRNSNQLFPTSSPLLDRNGFAFTDTMDDTSFEVDLFAKKNGTYGAHILDSDNFLINDSATFTLGYPESDTLALNSALLSENQAIHNGNGTEALTFAFAAAPVAATPEPDSMALVGTGLLGAAALARRRVTR